MLNWLMLFAEITDPMVVVEKYGKFSRSHLGRFSSSLFYTTSLIPVVFEEEEEKVDESLV